MEDQAPKDERFALKIKIKSLAEEARIIRADENRLDCTDQQDRYKQQSLVNHRKHVVRPEARATLLAYAYIRGQIYRKVEPISDTEPEWRRVRKMVETYGPKPFDEAAFNAWKNGTEVPAPAPKSFLSKLLSCSFP